MFPDFFLFFEFGDCSCLRSATCDACEGKSVGTNEIECPWFFLRDWYEHNSVWSFFVIPLQMARFLASSQSSCGSTQANYVTYLIMSEHLSTGKWTAQSAIPWLSATFLQTQTCSLHTSAPGPNATAIRSSSFLKKVSSVPTGNALSQKSACCWTRSTISP